MLDGIIIGGGVIGGMAARELTAYGAKVAIVEKAHDVAMGATRANSAIVHAGFDAKEGTLKARFNVRGSEMMPEARRTVFSCMKGETSGVMRMMMSATMLAQIRS